MDQLNLTVSMHDVRYRLNSIGFSKAAKCHVHTDLSVPMKIEIPSNILAGKLVYHENNPGQFAHN